jgi:ABC-type Zn uptake system ZnuABC Zn-binding protein ZnuA
MRRVLAVSMAALTLLISQACSRAPESEVIAADGALCDITRRLAAGDLRVQCLLGPSDDPHQLQLTPEQTRQIREAQLVLINGYGLTPALERLPEAVKVAEIAVPDSPALQTRQASEHHDHGHAHGDQDPHVWHDPRQAAAMTDLVSQQLQALNPAAAAKIQARSAAMQTSLKALHSWNQQQFATIPSPRILASSHRAFASLTRAYGLEELAVIDATSTSESLRPQALASAVSTLEQRRVLSLFAEQSPPSKSLQRISSLSGVRLATQPLMADTTGDHLMSTLTSNTCLIVDALGGLCNRQGAEVLVQSWDAIR